NNLVYVVSANVSGAFHRGRVENAPRTETIGGGSRIIDYRGRTMSEEPETRQSVAVSAMLDIGALRSARSDMSMANRLAQLRTEAVRTTYERVSIYPPNAFRERPLQRWNEIDGPRKEAVNAISALHRSRDRSAVADGGSGAA